MRESKYPAGRMSEFMELTEVLRDVESTGVLLAGTPGCGKMPLVEAVMSSMTKLDPSIRLICSSSLTSVEYGALAPLLSGLSEDINMVTAVRNSLASVREILHGYSAETKLLVVLEDAQFVDSASAYVLGQIVQAGLIRLIVVTSEDHMDAMSLDQLTIGSRLHRIGVGRLPLGEIVAQCEELLGGRISEGAAQIIEQQTHGIYFLIREFVISSRRQSVLVERHGRWVLRETGPQPDDELREKVLGLHLRHSLGMRSAMEMLSLAGELPIILLQELTGIERAHIDQNGLIHSDGRKVRISSKFYATVLRTLIPPGKGLALKSRLRDATAGISDPSLEQLMWRQEEGMGLELTMILNALRTANAAGRFEAAWQLYKATEQQGSEELCVEAARSLVRLGRPQTALALLESFSGSEGTSFMDRYIGDARALCSWISLDLVTSDSVSGTGMRRGNGALGDGPGSVDLSLGHDQQPGNQLLVDGQSGEHGDKWFIGMLSSIQELYASGRLPEAAELASDIRRVNGDTLAKRSTYELALTVAEARSYIAAGDYGRAEVALAEFAMLEDGEILFAHGTLQIIKGFMAMRQGRTALSVDLAQDGIAELSVNDPVGLKLLAMGISTFLSSLRPHAEADANDFWRHEGHLDAGPQEGAGAFRGHWSESDRFLADTYRELASDQPRPAELRRQLELAIAGSDKAAVTDVAFMCWSADISPELTQIAAGVLMAIETMPEGARPALQRRLVDVEQARDMSLLNEFAMTAFEAGEPVLAIEGLARSVRFQNDPGNERQRGMALRQIDVWLRELDASPWGLVAETLSARGLTSRETEIVELVRSGLSNKEIARYLTVSQRTVEGHLYRVFAKLGINDRKELGESK